MSEHTIKSITPTRFIIKTTRTWQTPESSKSCSSSSGLNNNNRKTGSDWRIIAASSVESELGFQTPIKFRIKNFCSSSDEKSGTESPDPERKKSEKSRSSESKSGRKSENKRLKIRSANVDEKSQPKKLENIFFKKTVPQSALHKKFEAYKAEMLSFKSSHGSLLKDNLKDLNVRIMRLNRDQKALKKLIRVSRKEDWSKLSKKEIREKKEKALQLICSN